MFQQTLTQALQQLSADNENHWTADGLPRIETLKFLTGDNSLTREAINLVAPGFTRTNVVPTELAETTSEISTLITTDSEEVSLDEILAKEEEVIEGLYQEKDKLDKLIKEKTKLITDLSDAVAKQNGIVTSQDAIRLYLDSQQKVLLERAERIKMISESGLNLKELAANLKSPLDASLSRKSKSR